MDIKRIRQRRLVPVALAMAMLVGTVTAGGTLAASATASTSGTTWTAAQVAAVTKGHSVIPIFAVPKKLPALTIGFIHNDVTVPTFATWQIAFKAAAKFYGVKFIWGDEGPPENNDANIPNVFNTLKLEHPNVVGSQHVTPALCQLAAAAKIPIIGLDASPLSNCSISSFIGLPDAQAGRIAGSLLAQTLLQKIKGPWKGKQIYYLGMSYYPCTPCEIRTNKALAQLNTFVDIPQSNVLISKTAATPADQEAFVTNAMEAHPNGVFVMASLNDEYGIPAFEAARANGRTSDLIGATIGCDSAGLAALHDSANASMYLGCVNANAWAEGWNFMEAAIATALHKPYGQMRLHQILTPTGSITVKGFDTVG